MIWTAKDRKIARGCAEHIKAGLGCATDYKVAYADLQIWFDGKVERIYGDPRKNDGGRWLWIKENKTGISWQFAHLSLYRVRTGDVVKAGQIVALTGNTGYLTTGPHLHVQALRDGKRLDPEKHIIIQSQPMDMRRHHVKMIYLAYGLAPSSSDVDYWAGQSDQRIMVDLPYELCKQVDPDGTASTRVDYFNKLGKKALKRDMTVEEQNTFSSRQEPLRGVTDHILSK
jgi:murein DD-endopeptidase MepM/ murein hydrolase activator NlpD